MFVSRNETLLIYGNQQQKWNTYGQAKKYTSHVCLEAVMWCKLIMRTSTRFPQGVGVVLGVRRRRGCGQTQSPEPQQVGIRGRIKMLPPVRLQGIPCPSWFWCKFWGWCQACLLSTRCKSHQESAGAQALTAKRPTRYPAHILQQVWD